METDKVTKDIASAATATQESTGKPQRDINRLYLLMAGVIIVLLVGFATGFIALGSYITTSNAEKQATFQNLENQIQAQNAQIQVLTNQLKNSTVTPR
jgi:hypothetical protein